MKPLLRTFLVFLLVAPLLSQAQSPEAALVTEPTFEAAAARSRKEGRLLFVHFMSSTCPHCKKFREQVVDTAVFREFAARHLVMLTYDIFALEGLPQSEQKVERELEEKFEVERTPTVLVVSSEGKVLLRMEGYGGSPPEKVVASLRALVEPPK